MSWSLTLFVLVMPFAGLLTGRIGKGLKNLQERRRTKWAKYSVQLMNRFQIDVIKAFNAEKKMEKRFAKETGDYYKTMNRLMWRVPAHPVSEFFGYNGNNHCFVVWWPLIENEGGWPRKLHHLPCFFYSIINPAKAFSSAFYSIEKAWPLSIVFLF